ncbi:thiamine pyrophosphate-binding protein [Amaricoccus solimangrovi]|uniref:Thiamine pyrophosphate-binding protein n=1 Tax=Amaricoccus solimangrovi TaxID=2589815 RepID=A0A501WEC4_9RHOB|nr:thiamine pyrophosphate-binding protein [Amaricoccus solimangrovi]TPE48183.1 thiamine pyrophosphate-binding protein [Amaricoccus solimangrovi]
MLEHRDNPPGGGAAGSGAAGRRDNSLSRDPGRVADRVAATLALHGVRAAFGMPGGEVVTLVDALDRAGIPFHLARHETQAALMAAGESTVSGGPGLLVTTLGPGLANAVNGIADAAQERVPLIVLSGVVDRATRGRYTHQVIDHARLLAPLVKGSFELGPEGAAAVVARAIRLATAAPMGPVHLDLSPEVAAAASPEPGPVALARAAAPRIAPDDPVILELADRIDRAERPLVIAGFEAARHPEAGCVRAFLETLGAPVITTYKAKGLLPEDRAPALGAAGLSPRADAALRELVDRADLMLLLGYDPIEMRAGWLDALGDPGRIVAVSAAPADHGMHTVGLAVTADLGALASALTPRVTAKPFWTDGGPARVRSRLAAIFAGPEGWGPHAVFETLNALAGDALVTVDSGAHRILMSQKWTARRPLTLLQSAGFCTMAAALPLAIGAAVAAPGRRVIAVMGDGGLEMGIGELATLRDLGLPVTIVVLQDRALSLIALKQAAAGLGPRGVALGPTDFPAVARAFGGHGIAAHDAPTLARALREAEARAGFTLIACGIDADAYERAF